MKHCLGVFGALVLAACGGAPGSKIPEQSDAGGPNGGAATVSGGVRPGPAGLRRLTGAEYRRTLETLTGVTPPVDTLDPEPWNKAGFDNFATDLVVTPTFAAQTADVAAKLARQLQAPPCSGEQTDCARTFIADFGRRAFRSPLTDAERERYLALYRDERSRSDHAGGLSQVVETMLQSPRFLYRFELGAGTGTERRLTPHELASALSYLFTGTMPDGTLAAAADSGQLDSRQAIEEQARRLLGAPSTKETLRGLLIRYAGIARLPELIKNTQVYPQYSSELRAAMQGETERFIDEVLWQQDGTFRSLLTAPYSFVNKPLADLYGLSATGAGDGDGYVKTLLDPAQRMGLLTHASVLAVHSKADESFPILRGKFIRVGLLCHDLPAPPPVVPEAPQPSPDATTRERFAQHSADPACSGCHQLIDPLGFGLENYDGIGQYRASENGLPVDSSGVISGTVDIDGPYSGAIELASRLAQSRDAQACFARYALRWAMGRFEVEGEMDQMRRAVDRLASGGLDIRELLVSLATSDAFTLRTFE